MVFLDSFVHKSPGHLQTPFPVSLITWPPLLLRIMKSKAQLYYWTASVYRVFLMVRLKIKAMLIADNKAFGLTCGVYHHCAK
jgi:hypothetical protein